MCFLTSKTCQFQLNKKGFFVVKMPLFLTKKAVLKICNSQTGYYTCITNKKQSEHFCVLYTLNSYCLIYHLSNIEFLVLWYLTYQAQCLCTSFRSFKECPCVLLCSGIGAVAKTQLNTICFNQKKS